MFFSIWLILPTILRTSKGRVWQIYFKSGVLGMVMFILTINLVIKEISRLIVFLSEIWSMIIMTYVSSRYHTTCVFKYSVVYYII